MSRHLIIAAAFVIAPVLFAAERVVLRDGTVVEGHIRTQNRNIVIIDTKAGRQTLAKSAITRVVFGLPDPEDIEKKKADEAKAKARELEEKTRAVLDRTVAADEARAAEQVARVDKWEKKLQTEAAQKEAEQAALKEAQAKGNGDPLASDKSSRGPQNPSTTQKDPAGGTTTNARSANVDPGAKDTAKDSQTPAKETAMNDKAAGAYDSSTREMEPGISRGTAMLYSAFLPGLGQMRSRRPVSGSIYMGLFLGALYGTYNQNRLYMNARKEYEQYNNPYNPNAMELSLATGTTFQANPYSDNLYITSKTYEQKRGTVEKFFRARNQFAGLAVLVYAASLSDAFFFTPQKTAFSGHAPSDSFSFFVAPAPPVFVATLKPDAGLTAGFTTPF